MKLSISGYGSHGKDELAQSLAKVTTLRYKQSTSQFAAQLVFEHSKTLGMKYLNVEDCYNDRRNHRDMWVQFIDEYNRYDKAALYKDCLKDQDILTGVRRPDEFLAARPLVDLAIWIERPNYDKSDHTQQYGPELCDIIVLNDGTLDDLLRKTMLLGRLWHINKCEGYIHKFYNQRCEYCYRTLEELRQKC